MKIWCNIQLFLFLFLFLLQEEEVESMDTETPKKKKKKKDKGNKGKSRLRVKSVKMCVLRLKNSSRTIIFTKYVYFLFKRTIEIFLLFYYWF